MKGIFTLLNDECMTKIPSTKNFSINLKNAWTQDKSSLISWRVGSEDNSFVIRHFTNSVIYSTVGIGSLNT